MTVASTEMILSREMVKAMRGGKPVLDNYGNVSDYTIATLPTHHSHLRFFHHLPSPSPLAAAVSAPAAHPRASAAHQRWSSPDPPPRTQDTAHRPGCKRKMLRQNSVSVAFASGLSTRESGQPDRAVLSAPCKIPKMNRELASRFDGQPSRAEAESARRVELPWNTVLVSGALHERARGVEYPHK